jgi:hypothetical protein
MSKLPPNVAPDEQILSVLAYAHTRGGFVVRPDDVSGIRGRALEAMEAQVETQLSQIYGQVEVLARQARELRRRAEISYKIYECDLRFDPVINQIYYLYEEPGGKPWLSLIAPDEWGVREPKHAATVRLLADHTWDVIESHDAPSEAAGPAHEASDGPSPT